MKKLLLHSLVCALLLPATASLARQKIDDMKSMNLDQKPTAPTQSTRKAIG